MLNIYVNHWMLLSLIGRHWCKNIGNEAFLEDMNAVVTENNHAEELKLEFDI